MKITDAIRGEHAVYYAWLDELEQLASSEKPKVSIPAFCELFRSTLGTHAMLEDELLFGALDSIESAKEPLQEVRNDHRELYDMLNELCDVTDSSQARQLARQVVQLGRVHFTREEDTLFPLAEQHLDKKRLLDAGDEWAKRRNVCVGAKS